MSVYGIQAFDENMVEMVGEFEPYNLVEMLPIGDNTSSWTYTYTAPEVKELYVVGLNIPGFPSLSVRYSMEFEVKGSTVHIKVTYQKYNSWWNPTHLAIFNRR